MAAAQQLDLNNLGLNSLATNTARQRGGGNGNFSARRRPHNQAQADPLPSIVGSSKTKEDMQRESAAGDQAHASGLSHQMSGQHFLTRLGTDAQV